MTKLTFDEALERLADERRIERNDVQAAALRRKVWLAEWHLPGCLSESQSINLTKEDAIATAIDWADGEDGPPRGMTTALRKHGFLQHSSQLFGTVITTVKQHTLGDLL